jgi:hypothetical protein
VLPCLLTLLFIRACNSGSGSKDRWPLIVKNNVYILPGVPEYCKAKFLLVKDDLVRQPFFVAKMYINEAEPQIADILTRASSVLKTVNILACSRVCLDLTQYFDFGNVRHQTLIPRYTKP